MFVCVIPSPGTQNTFSYSTCLDSVSNTDISFVDTFMPGHPAVETLNITTRNTFEFVDPLTTRTARGLREGFPFSTKWQRLNSSSESIRYNVTVLLSKSPLDHRDVGRVAVFGERTGPCGFTVSGGARITFSNVTAYACANECFTSSHTTQLSILGGGIVFSELAQ